MVITEKMYSRRMTAETQERREKIPEMSSSRSEAVNGIDRFILPMIQ